MNFYKYLTEEDFRFFVRLELKFGLDLTEEEADKRYEKLRSHYNRETTVEQLGFLIMKKHMCNNK